METQIETNPVQYVYDWAVTKIDLLHEADRHRNAEALHAEFREWIDHPEDEDLNYFFYRDDNFGDQEIEVQ